MIVQSMFRINKLNSMCGHGSVFCRHGKKFMAMGASSKLYSDKLSSGQALIIERLAKRSLVRLAGTDALHFLQGLITNDMHHFEDDKKGSMYAMMLNQQGRVLYDVIIYAQRGTNGELSYLLECDSVILPEICKHLKIYRVRKKVDITPMEGQLCVWSIFPHPKFLQQKEIAVPEMQNARLVDDQSVDHCGKIEEINIAVKIGSDQVHALAKDPRLASLGWRLILSEGAVPKDTVINQNIVASEEECYRTRLYRLGIGEGVSDLPPANCLPLECNLDYLHGVSFHKGCYIGQELTARVHHTGVVRKRLLPMIFEDAPSTADFDPKHSSIINEDGKNVGKLLGHLGNFGLGLLRIQECIYSKKKLKLQGIQSSIGFTAFKPFWWPLEVSKESLVIKNP